jgi:CheY-like chemotaxis protein
MDKPQKTLLIADDEELVRRAGERMLSKLGYAVLTADNGASAIETFRRHRAEIALVLLDLVMPDMDGLETLQRLREIDPEVRVVLCSGYAKEDASESQALIRSTAGFVRKPFSMAELSRVVSRLV